MTIDDRLTRAGQQFRDTHTAPAQVDLGAPATARPRTRAPRRRLGAVGSTVLVLAAVTAGVLVWLGTSRPAPQQTPAGPTSAASAAADLARGPWVLVAADDDGGDIALPTAPSYPADVRFDLTTDRMTVTASDGCNDFGAEVTVGVDQLTFGEGSLTAVGCPDDGAALRAAIGRVFFGGHATWTVANDRLVLRGDGVTLTYDRRAPVPGTASDLATGRWELVSAEVGTTPVPIEVERGLTALMFDISSGDPTVYDGCNPGFAPVRIDDDTLTFGELGPTKLVCAGTAELEHAMDGVIASGPTTWEVSGDRLTLSRGSNHADLHPDGVEPRVAQLSVPARP